MISFGKQVEVVEETLDNFLDVGEHRCSITQSPDGSIDTIEKGAVIIGRQLCNFVEKADLVQSKERRSTGCIGILEHVDGKPKEHVPVVCAVFITPSTTRPRITTTERVIDDVQERVNELGIELI